MTHLKSNQGLGNEIYKKSFAERKAFGDKSESCFNEYLIQKYGKGNFLFRQEEENVDFKLPDFVIKLPDQTFEVEIKSTDKVKYENLSYQYSHAVKNNILIYFTRIIILSKNSFKYRPIEIRKLLNYRVFDEDGVYEDSTPKPYFIVDWQKRYPQDFGWKTYSHATDFLIF